MSTTVVSWNVHLDKLEKFGGGWAYVCWILGVKSQKLEVVEVGQGRSLVEISGLWTQWHPILDIYKWHDDYIPEITKLGITTQLKYLDVLKYLEP